MSLQPTSSSGYKNSLLGQDYLYNFKNIPLRNQTLYRRNISADNTDDDNNPKTIPSNRSIIILSIVGAILFILVVSLFDIVRNWINNYYAEKALRDSASNVSTDDINSTIIANYQSLIASIVFAIFCVIVGVVSVYFLLRLM